jgi:CRP/FNR family transcriptional regulator
MADAADGDFSLATLYPGLASVDIPEAVRTAGLAAVDVPAGAELFSAGAPCAGFPLVLRGEVRVARASEAGRQLELYRVVPGELCLVSSASLFGRHPMTASGTATQPTRLLMIPPALFDRWLEVPTFRQFVLTLFAERMADLAGLIDAVAFRRLDQRLAAALLGHGVQRRITHQGLADELGTVREIVTRLLHRFEREGWVELGREQIRVLDGAALRALSLASPPAAAR